MKQYLKYVMSLLILFSSFINLKAYVFNASDSALIKVVYERTMLRDTLNPDNSGFKEYLTLLVGKCSSIFYSEIRHREDQRMFSDMNYFKYIFLDTKRRHAVTSLENDVIFRDYLRNKTVAQHRYDLTHWEMVEDMEKPEWYISDSICNVAGYDCIMATAKFRGRQWFAYFSPEIPIAEGPWKLCGLPGLVLKAHDSKFHYAYEAKEIDSSKHEAIPCFDRASALQIKDRIKGLTYRKKCQSIDITAKVKAIAGLKTDTKPSRRKKEVKRFDFEETDYPHD